MKTFLLEANSNTRPLKKLPSKIRLVGTKEFASTTAESNTESLYIAEGLEALNRVLSEAGEDFFRHQAQLRKYVKICLISESNKEPPFSLTGIFKNAISIPKGSSLPLDELLEIINGKNSDRYVIGGKVDEDTHTVTLVRGDLSPIVIPLSTFRESGNGISPDFSHFSVEDYGQTLKFGEYEASVDSVLYEFDPLYRRARRAELVKKDKSFGSCLRRLRLQKGYRQTDFPDLDPREIGRIERGEVQPRKGTLAKIAATLGVKAEEIKEY